LGGEGGYRATYGKNDGPLLPHKIGGEPRQSIVLTVSPAIVEGDVLTLDKACLIEALADDRNEGQIDSGRTAAEQSDHRHRPLLRARRQRPGRCCAAEKADELAALHSNSSSARPDSGSGTVRPSALAVCKLMYSSTFVASWTGRSAGLAPLSTRPV